MSEAIPSVITLFHTTTTENAGAILQAGYGEGDAHHPEGIWFSDRPLSRGTVIELGNIPEGWTVLTLTLDSVRASEYEVLADNPAQAFREWRVPASIANREGKTVEALRTVPAEG
jgi:hypothetical protein